ncbi:MAG: hypothetical protein ACRDD7_18280 [Peptostreptococcaceae bacterium]
MARRKKVNNDAIKYNYDDKGNVIQLEAIESRTVQPDGRIHTNKIMVEGTLAKPKKILSALNPTTMNYVEISGAITQENQYKVDYVNGDIYFHNSQTGTDIKTQFMFIGEKLGDASEIYVNKNSDGTVTKSLTEEFRDVEEMVNNMSSEMTTNYKNYKIYNGREVLYDGVNYGFDLANLVGQGLYPKNSIENNNFRAMVIHNYVDTEILTLDNCGEMPAIFIRNARNAQRRLDKPSNFIPQSNFLQFQQAFMNKNPDGTEGTTHSFVTMFNMDYLGNMYWRDNRPEVTSAKLQTVSQSLADSSFAFVIGSYYDTRFIADFQYANNKSALKIARDTSGNTQVMTQLNGLKFSAFKGNTIFESLEGSVILKGETGVFASVGGVNLPLARFVASKPATPTSVGSKGDYFADSLHLYVCYNPNMWIRINKSEWTV